MFNHLGMHLDPLSCLEPLNLTDGHQSPLPLPVETLYRGTGKVGNAALGLYKQEFTMAPERMWVYSLWSLDKQAK
jgi:hypothetical protein